MRLELEEFEVELLRALPAGLGAVLADPDTNDPVIARLFPACVTGEEETDLEVRRLIFDDLLRERLAGLEALTEILDRGERRRGRFRVELVAEEPELVLAVLNDLRLMLGARVGIENLDRDNLPSHHPLLPTLAVMDHLGWLQEQLLRVLDSSSVADYGDPV
ncbi:MAG: DUF2017 family protein [Nitriliruptorales bacterium]